MMQYVVDLLEEFSDYFGTILKYIGLCVLCMLMMQHGGNILDEFSSSVMAAVSGRGQLPQPSTCQPGQPSLN